MSQDFLAPPKRRYICVFEKAKPGWTLKIPEVEFEAMSEAEAYRYVIEEILGKSGGFEAVASLALYKPVGNNGSRVPMMRWRPGPGWEFMDGRQPSLFEAPPSRTPWYGDGKK